MNDSKNAKILVSWCLYDWACSGFPIIVTTFIFATYFTSKVAINEIAGTYQWANATALAGFIIACASPIFGAIADQSGGHKKWLLFFTLLCVLSATLLWFAYPLPRFINYTLACVVIGTIGLEIGAVFYNSFLAHIAPPAYLGRLSGVSWGLGYLGGIIILSIALFVFVKNPPHFLNSATAEQVRICGPLVGIWFVIFAIPLFIFLPEVPTKGLGVMPAIKLGIKELMTTLSTLPQQKNLLLYLIAHMIYIDGLNTLFAFGGIYAAGTFKMSLAEVILFGLTMNMSAGIGAIALAWVDDFLGSKQTILIALLCMIIFGIPLLLVQSATVFWILGLLLSAFLGPVQSASRSFMVRIMPEQKSTELFGLYAFSGKITAFFGPWCLGFVTLHAGSQRAGMAVVILFFILGAFLMCFVRQEQVLLAKNVKMR